MNSEAPVNLHKISFEPGPFGTKVILEADAPLTVAQTYYAAESPATVVFKLANTQTTLAKPALPENISPVKDVQIAPSEDTGLQLLVQLTEPVPYRIVSTPSEGPARFVAEFLKIQGATEDYFVSPEITRELERQPTTQIILDKIQVTEKNSEMRISARLSGIPVYKIFALGNPLRLVIDLFQTRFTQSFLTYPLDRYGVEQLRVSQFQNANPLQITRLVFNLSQPDYYALNFTDKNLVISFFRKAQEVAPSVISASKPSQEAAPSKTENTQKVEAPPKEKPRAAPSASRPAEENKPAQEQEENLKTQTIADREEEIYSGEIISPRFKDADIRDVILYLAGEMGGLNVIFDEEVGGTVTCNLMDVPWDQALDVILKNKKLGKTLEGNVLRIAPMTLLTREQEEERALRESREIAGPVQIKTFALSYSKARDIQQLLQSKKSSRGEITVDERTNTLIISDVKEKLDLIEKLISVLDTPTPQVSIEARIVEASSTFVRNLGIQWGFFGAADPFYGNQTSLQFPNKIQADGRLIPTGIVTKGIGGPLGGYAINLPAPAFNTAIGLSIANVMDTFRLDTALSAMETSGEGQIISSPKITSQNNKEAEIFQGRQIPVQTQANFTVTTRYVNAGLEMRATPQITAEGTIIMTIEINNNAADFANLVQGIPPITTQRALTTVMVPDGGTTVIGGIYRTEDSITREKVPFLHKIPILGSLFRNSARMRQNRELLIFITPRIIK
jgi:type IV pilus assembly protein PilQ